MTYQPINFGTTAPNDGETLKSYFTKADAMFAELYANSAAISVLNGGDGVANDTAALVAAIAVGGILAVPAGTYLIDPTEINNPIHILMHPEAVFKRRSATSGAASALLKFISGSEGSSISGGIIDGNRSTVSGSYVAPVVWSETQVSGVDRISIYSLKYQNCTHFPFWIASGDGHYVNNITIENCGVAGLFQFTNDSTLSNVYASGIGNDGVVMYQHAFEMRNLNRCRIENLRINGYDPDANGIDPFPVSFALERIFSCKVSGLFLDGYDGTETRNFGAQISNAQDSSFSDIHLKDVFRGIDCATVVNSTISSFTTHGGFVTNGSSDGYGIGFRAAGVFQNNGDVVAYDTESNRTSQGVTVIAGSCIGHEMGASINSSGITLIGVRCNANATHGFQIREVVTNDNYNQVLPRIESVKLIGCEGRFNGFDGVIGTAGDDVVIDGGDFSNNGWDTSLGATFRTGVGLIGDTGAGGLNRWSISNILAGDTQTFTKTAGFSFKPGSTDANHQYTGSFIDPDQTYVGQWLTFKNVTGSGDKNARIISLNLDEAVLQFLEAVTLSATGNTIAGTGTISSSGNTVTGSGTAFNTQIRGAAWIRVSGTDYHVARVDSNTSMVIYPAPSPALSGAAFTIIAIDVVGIPSQQHAIVANADVTGPISLSHIRADGAVTAPYSISSLACLEEGTNSFMANAGLQALGGNLSLGTTSTTYRLNVFDDANPVRFVNNANAAANQAIRLESDRASPANNDSVYASFLASDSAGNQDEFARITANVQTVTSTSEVGNLEFSIMASGALASRLVLATGSLRPATDGGIGLGTTTLGYNGAFYSSGATWNFANGNWLATHSSGVVTVGTGDLRVTNAGTNAASVVTLDGAQTLGNKSVTSPTITGSPTAATATWINLGAVTTIDINGGTIDGATIGGSSAAAATFTTVTASGLVSGSVAGLPARFTNTTDAAANQGFRIDSDRATPANNDSVYLSFYCSDSAGNQDEFGRITANVQTVTSASELGFLEFSIMVSGALASRAILASGNFRPSTNGGITLGTTSSGFGGVHLSSAASVNWANGEITITPSDANTLVIAGASTEVDVQGPFRADSLRIDQAASTVGTGAKTISNAADSSTNFGKYFSFSLNGTTVYVPCGTVAPT